MRGNGERESDMRECVIERVGGSHSASRQPRREHKRQGNERESGREWERQRASQAESHSREAWRDTREACESQRHTRSTQCGLDTTSHHLGSLRMDDVGGFVLQSD